MITLDPIKFHAALDDIFGFVGFEAEPAPKTSSVQAARNALRAKGWTQAAAAQVLGVTPIHLCYVLNGRRESRRVLTAIQHLPTNPDPA
jgi:hypothetical protein